MIYLKNCDIAPPTPAPVELRHRPTDPYPACSRPKPHLYALLIAIPWNSAKRRVEMQGRVGTSEPAPRLADNPTEQTGYE